MGTRADFYLGKRCGVWLGSIAYDGDVDSMRLSLIAATTQAGFLDALREFVQGRSDWTSFDKGWPWPWPNSCTTDFAYAFDEGWVWVSNFGSDWQKAIDWKEADSPAFPDMASRAVPVPAGDARSGILSVNKKGEK